MAFAIAPSHQLSAEITYYTNDTIFVHADKIAKISQFNLWPCQDELKNKNGFYIWFEGDAVGPYEEYFDSTRCQDAYYLP